MITEKALLAAYAGLLDAPRNEYDLTWMSWGDRLALFRDLERARVIVRDDCLSVDDLLSMLTSIYAS